MPIPRWSAPAFGKRLRLEPAPKLHEMKPSATRAARKEAGPDLEPTVDVNCPRTLTQARARAEELKAVALKWLEEPLGPPENFAGLAELRRTSGIPIAAGENVPTLIDFARLLAAKALDLAQPSPARPAVHNIPAMPHDFCDIPGLLAAVHATAALSTAASMIEWRPVRSGSTHF